MKISVVIPTHNRYEFLKRAILSVVMQTHIPDEIIIVDDGSSDNTSKITLDFPLIKYIYQENAGVSSARNLGIKNAKYDWVAFLDSDDEWHPDKLKEQIYFHKKNPNILMSYTDELWIRDGIELKIPKKFAKFGGEIFERCLSHCIIAPSSSLMHKSLLDKVGAFDQTLEVCEDYDLWLRVAISHQIGLINQKLITKYAGHENQLSFKHWGMDRFRVIALEKLLADSNVISSKIRNLLITTLLQKYSLLLKGAIKYDKITEISQYKEKINFHTQR